MRSSGLIFGPKHEQGGIDITVKETHENKEVEGGEYFLCSDAFLSEKVHEFTNKTARQILDAIYFAYQCPEFSPELSASDYIVCALTVEDPTQRTVKGTVKQILDVLQGAQGCYVMNKAEYHSKMAKGGPTSPELQNAIDAAKRLGKEAAEKGAQRAPVLNPVIMDMIKSWKDEGLDQVLKAYLDAYDKVTSKQAFEAIKTSETLAMTDKQIMEKYPVPTKSEAERIYNESLTIIKAGGPKNDQEKYTLERYEGRGSMINTGKIDEGLLHQFYTPYVITKKMYELASHYGFNGGNILEPSCGSGRFFKFAPANSNLYGFDLDETNIEIVKALYPNVKSYKQEFETAFLQPPMYSKFRKLSWLEPMDLVIGNPPYGNYAGYYSSYMPKVYNRFEFLFIRLGLQVLKPGGILIYIISQNLMNNGAAYNKMKQDILDIGIFVDAIRMPNGIFANTEVGTDIVIFKRK